MTLERVLPILLAVLLASWTTPDLHAQTLSSSQRAKLDGRFERVLEKDAQGELKAAIEALPGPRNRRSASQSSRQSSKAKSQANEDRPFTRAESGTSTLPIDVRPAAYARDGTPIYEAMVHTSDAASLAAEGINVNSAFGSFATVRATPDQLRKMSQIEGVSRVQSARRVQLHNDEAAAEVGAQILHQGVGGTPYQGQTVMACVIDSGIDWDHPDFTDASGRTRIHSIWDQADDSTSTPSPVANNSDRFGPNFNPDYGAEFLSRDIRNGTVNQKDRNGHGTHVTGTVASSGQAFKQSSGVRKFRGVAPAADIIAVKAAFTGTTILDAVNYCKSVAESEGRPVAINMSLGTNFGPHDGTAPFARALDQITNEGKASGTVIVASAGNSGSPNNPIHVSGSVAAGDTADVSLSVSDYEPNDGRGNDFFVAPLWTYADGPYSLSVYTPSNEDTLSLAVEDPTAMQDTTIQTPRGAISISSAPLGSARFFEVASFDQSESRPPAEGTWTLRLRSEGSQSTEYHGWFGNSSMDAAFLNADNEFTIGIPATSRSAIAVGAYVQRTRWTSTSGETVRIPFSRDQAAPFTSRGPTVDGRQKPAISGPGAFTASALSGDAPGPLFGSRFAVGNGNHQLVTGTSMSAPVMTGTAALLLQEDPSLSTDSVRSLVTKTARADDAVGSTWNETFGFGKIDALGAMTHLRGDLSTAPLDFLTYEDEFGENAEATEAVGESGSDRLAVRFTPSKTGAVTGMLLSLAPSTSANSLTDSLTVQVWSDDGTGSPETPLGTAVSIPSTVLSNFTPNFVSLRGTKVAVTADTDYHLVLSPKQNGGTLEVLAETAGSNAGRSSVFESSSWSDLGNDLVVRAQVGGGLTTEDRTPPLASGRPATTATADSVVLDWGDFPAEDVREYRIYRDTSPIDSSAGPGAISALASVGARTTRYVDTNVSLNTQYYYRVTAVDTADNESGFSGESTATPRLPPDLATASTSLSQTLDLGTSATQTLQIENSADQGARRLHYSVLLRSAQSKSSAQLQPAARHPSSWSAFSFQDPTADPSTTTARLPHASSSLPILLLDPTDDAEQSTVDVTRVRTGVQAGTLKVALEHTSPLTASDYAGVMSFDVDQDASTGTPPIAANSDQVLGSEYAVIIARPEEGTAFLADTESFDPDSQDPEILAEIPVGVDSSTVHFAFPLSAIDGSVPMNTTGVVGTREAPTDWFPNAGNTSIGETPWLAASPVTGKIAAGASQDLSLSFDATRRAPGTYDATVRLRSNDPDEDPKDVGVSLTVEGLAPPSGLTASREGSDVTLDWDAPTGSSLAEYVVYRSTDPIPDNFGSASPVDSVSGGTTTFTDTSAPEGRTYFYRVSAVDGNGHETALSAEASAFLYPETVVADITRSFGDVAGATSYQLVALPGAVDRPLPQTLDGEAGLDWQAYWEEGSSVVQFDGSDTFNLRPGRGLWLTSTSDWTVQDEIETVSLRGDSAARIPLHGRWNIVSNPTDKPVSFRAIQRAQSTQIGPLLAFDGSFRLADTMRSARTGVAYYLFNDAGLDSLTIPYPGAPTQKGASETTEPDAFVLSARPADAEGAPTSRIRVEFTPDAKVGLDNRDLVAPPARFGVVGLRLDAPGPTETERSRVLMADRRPPPTGTGTEAGYTLELQLHARTEGRVQLEARRLRALENHAVQLLHPATGKTYDLRDASTVTIDPDGESTTLKLAVGSSAYVDRKAKNVVPSELGLTSYPNPMRQQGTVEYALPEASRVRLELYDLLGRRVATLVDRRRKAGRYRVEVETDRLSSGVYFGRLETDGQTRTQKITVVR